MNLHMADVRKHVTLKRLQPLLLVLLVPPRLAVSGDHPGRCLPECGYALCLAPLEDRIEPKLDPGADLPRPLPRSEEHTSELQSLMRISYAVFCLKKKNPTKH